MSGLPLRDGSRYKKARTSQQRHTVDKKRVTRRQVKDINSGSFGFVQLSQDRCSGEYYAIKHIERGPKVKCVALEICQHRTAMVDRQTCVV